MFWKHVSKQAKGDLQTNKTNIAHKTLPEANNYIIISQGDNTLFLHIWLMHTKEEMIC